MPIALPFSFLILQAGILALLPSLTAPTAYLAMVLAPALAAAAALRRGLLEASITRTGWFAIALSTALWSLGAFGNLWQEWVLGHVNEMYRSSMLAFNLSSVPIAYLLASEWRGGNRASVRVLDAGLALALGLAYFLYTWTAILDSAGPDEPGVAYLVWLIDAQNLYLTAGAAARWLVAQDRRERGLFLALLVYLAALTTIAGVNDHVFAGDPAYGPEYGSIVSLAYAALAYYALRTAPASQRQRASSSVVRGVRAASPIALAGALLIVSLFLIRANYLLGAAGVLIAVLGYGARSTLAHIQDVERNEALRQRQTELQAVAWTDALTGLSNRHFLEQVFRGVWRNELPSGRSLAVLMIDIDHFKLLNDHYGHPAGDTCLREVARALQGALVRPDDVVVRYGGEEFIALLQGVDLAGANVVAERLRLAVKSLRIEHAASPHGVVTVSIGVASGISDPKEAPERLIELADRALYEAKIGGRDQVRSRMRSAA